MITKCPVCKKEYDVLYPDKWAYKRGTTYYCSWKCLRTLDKPNDKGEKAEVKRRDITLEEKKKAVQIALAGKSPLEYLEGLGCKNAAQAWYGIKNKLKETDPDLYKRLPKKNTRRDRVIETPERVSIPRPPVDVPPATAAEAMEGMKAAADEFFAKCEDMGLKLDKEPAPTEFEMAKKITGLMVEIGDFHYYPRTEYVDWTPVGHTEIVSLNTDEWKQVIRDLPEVLKELGAIK